MNSSNLALRLEEFEFENPTGADVRTALHKPMAIVAPPAVQPRARRRLTLTARRILVRDPGLRQFRVF